MILNLIYLMILSPNNIWPREGIPTDMGIPVMKISIKYLGVIMPATFK